MSTKDITKEKLWDAYVNNGLTQKECADYFSCGHTSIGRYLDIFDIPKRPKTSSLVIDMTNEMIEILYGALLGDGCLFKSKTSVNADFEYVSKSFQHVDYVTKQFQKYSIKGIQYFRVYDERTEKTYETYRFKTCVSEVLTAERNKWYKDNIKHIPQDLIITPLICKIWYLGDGSLINFDGITRRLELCTQCFEKEEIEKIILPQLKEFEPRLNYRGKSYHGGTKGYSIVIFKQKNIKKFLEFIGDCPFDDYAYKWDFRSSFIPDYFQYQSLWRDLYNSGMTQVNIAKSYNCDKGTVYRVIHDIHISRKNHNEKTGASNNEQTSEKKEN